MASSKWPGTGHLSEDKSGLESVISSGQIDSGVVISRRPEQNREVRYFSLPAAMASHEVKDEILHFSQTEVAPLISFMIWGSDIWLNHQHVMLCTLFSMWNMGRFYPLNI